MNQAGYMSLQVRTIACLFSIVTLFAACREQPREPASTPEQVTLTYLRRGWSQPDDLPDAASLAQQFTLETRIRVKDLPVPETTLSNLDLSRKLLEEQRGVPDVMGIDVIWPGALEEHLLDLRPYLAAELSALDPKLVATYIVNGKVVAIPYFTHIGVLEYRSDLLREYGYKHPPRTWNELENMAERIQAGERAKGKKDFWGYVWQGDAAEGLTCNALEWQVAEGGGRIIEDDGTISVNNQATIRAWQRARRWIGWISPPSVLAYRELDSMTAFDSGKAAFRRTWGGAAYSRAWHWHAGLIHWRPSLLPDKTGYTSMPGGPGGRGGTLGGSGLAISRHSVHREEAVEFVRFLIRAELESKAGRIPQANAGPELRDLPSLLELYVGNSKPGQQKSLAVVRPSNVAGRGYEEATKAYISAVHSVLTGQKGAPQAAAELEKQLIKITVSAGRTGQSAN